MFLPRPRRRITSWIKYLPRQELSNWLVINFHGSPIIFITVAGFWSRCSCHRHVVAGVLIISLTYMMTSSNENISALLAVWAGSSPVAGEFPAQRPVTRSFDVFFDLSLNKRFSKQWWGWWFETLSCPLWRHCNGVTLYYLVNKGFHDEWQTPCALHLHSLP